MPLGIRPINDFAFKKTFGTAENRVALISLLNAILRPKSPIVEVTLENPFNLQDFKDDKLSILDIKAVDRTGAIYDIEMQLTTYKGLVETNRLLWLRTLRRPTQVGRQAQDPQSGLFDLDHQWHPVAGCKPGSPCFSPSRRRIGAGFGGNAGDSHIGTGKVYFKGVGLALGQHVGLLVVLALARPRVRARGARETVAAAGDTAGDGNA